MQAIPCACAAVLQERYDQANPEARRMRDMPEELKNAIWERIRRGLGIPASEGCSLGDDSKVISRETYRNRCPSCPNVNTGCPEYYKAILMYEVDGRKELLH